MLTIITQIFVFIIQKFPLIIQFFHIQFSYFRAINLIIIHFIETF